MNTTFTKLSKKPSELAVEDQIHETQEILEDESAEQMKSIIDLNQACSVVNIGQSRVRA